MANGSLIYVNYTDDDGMNVMNGTVGRNPQQEEQPQLSEDSSMDVVATTLGQFNSNVFT